MPRFMIELDAVTYQGLAELASTERRLMPQQAAWILMQAVKDWRKQQTALRHLEGASSAPADTEAEA